jgi:O-antigen ligase
MIKRTCGTLLHPNVFGGFLLMAILATYHLLACAKERREKWLFTLAIFLQMFTLFTTFSRAALIALFLATLLWLFLRKGEKAVIKSVAQAFVLSGTFSLFLLLPALQDRGGVVNYNQVAQVSDQGRVVFNDIAFAMIKAHPLLGVGYNSYILHMQEFSSVKLDPIQFFPVHNIYLLVAAEEGLIALFLFLLFLGAVLVKALKSSISFAGISLLAIFVGFLFIGGCDFYLLGSQHGKLMFFLIAGLLHGECQNEFIRIN